MGQKLLLSFLFILIGFSAQAQWQCAEHFNEPLTLSEVRFQRSRMIRMFEEISNDFKLIFGMMNFRVVEIEPGDLMDLQVRYDNIHRTLMFFEQIYQGGNFSVKPIYFKRLQKEMTDFVSDLNLSIESSESPAKIKAFKERFQPNHIQ